MDTLTQENVVLSQNESVLPESKNDNHPQSNFLVILLSVFLTLSVLISGFFAYQTQKLVKELDSLKTKEKVTAVFNVEPTVEPVATTSAVTTDSTANWKTYTNSSNNFLIKYPSGWSSDSQGPTKDAWQQISSPDLASKGSQQPKIGMSMSVRVYKQDHKISQDELDEFGNQNGVAFNYSKLIVIQDKIGFVKGETSHMYEYESTDTAYKFHFWELDVVNNESIISIVITDFNEDPNLNPSQIASQILSTFKFTN